MQVDGKRATAAGLQSAHGGKAYFFCSEDCKKHFDAEPGTFANK
jgi:YHS domain-containing protein